MICGPEFGGSLEMCCTDYNIRIQPPGIHTNSHGMALCFLTFRWHGIVLPYLSLPLSIALYVPFVCTTRYCNIQ